MSELQIVIVLFQFLLMVYKIKKTLNSEVMNIYNPFFFFFFSTFVALQLSRNRFISAILLVSGQIFISILFFSVFVLRLFTAVHAGWTISRLEYLSEWALDGVSTSKVLAAAGGVT